MQTARASRFRSAALAVALAMSGLTTQAFAEETRCNHTVLKGLQNKIKADRSSEIDARHSISHRATLWQYSYRRGVYPRYRWKISHDRVRLETIQSVHEID